MVLMLGIGILIYMIFAANIALTEYSINLLFLAISLPLIALLLFRLYRFKDVPLELAESGDGRLKIRMLDRGDGQWQKMKLGYQVVSSHVKKVGKKIEIIREVLYKTDSPLPDIGQRREHFIEATLPWPQWPHEKLPVSYQKDSQGYTWEIYLKTPGLFSEQVQTWPIAVSREAFRLPGEGPATEDFLSEESLELPPLKEVIRLKNENFD